jgi:crotonobetainyl-CoA:carnitine CoA-transferase CaiB-like acyl-CoA transferase
MALQGVKVLEFSGLAPVPYCGMILADFGADVIRIDRVNNKLEITYAVKILNFVALIFHIQNIFMNI